MRRFIADSKLPLLAFVVAAALGAGCKGKDDRATAPSVASSASPSAPPSASASPSSGAAAPAPLADAGPCRATAGFDVAPASRAETGATIATLDDGRIAVGYAVGTSPKVSIVDPDGAKATEVDVDSAAFEAAIKALPKGTTVTLPRVTPIGVSGMKVRVAVDAVLTMPDKTKRATCALGDSAAFASAAAEGAAFADLFDCRTVIAGGQPRVPASRFRAGKDDATRETAWVLADAAHAAPPDATADAGAGDVTLAARSIAADKAGSSRYAFELSAIAEVPGAGAVVASRHDGKLVLSRRGEGLASVDDATFTWLGAPIGAPAMVAANRVVFAFVPVSGGAVYGATFPIEGKPAAPERLTLPTDAAAEGERTSLAAAVLSSGDVLLASIDGKATKRARFVLLDAALKPYPGRIEAGDDPAQASVVRVHALANRGALVVHRSGSKLRGTVLDCAPPAR